MACSTTPKPAEAPPPAPPSAEQLLEEGKQAHAAGDATRALDLWREAAKSDPAAKEPWLRMAQLHFERSDYGATITAAHEARQRDPGDATANGLLAVSGLRVSSDALARMRAEAVTEALTGSTRSEAESLAKTLRDVLGTPVLVPQPANKAGAASGGTTTARGSTSRSQRRPSTKTSSTGEASPATSASSSRDPFGALR